VCGFCFNIKVKSVIYTTFINNNIVDNKAIIVYYVCLGIVSRIIINFEAFP